MPEFWPLTLVRRRRCANFVVLGPLEPNLNASDGAIKPKSGGSILRAAYSSQKDDLTRNFHAPLQPYCPPLKSRSIAAVHDHAAGLSQGLRC